MCRAQITAISAKLKSHGMSWLADELLQLACRGLQTNRAVHLRRNARLT